MRTRAVIRATFREATREYKCFPPSVSEELARKAVSDMGGPGEALRGIVMTSHLWACLMPDGFFPVAPKILAACGPEVVPDLCDLVTKDDQSALIAIVALGQIGDMRAEPTLLKLAESPPCVPDVYEALGLLRSRKAVDPLISVVSSSDSDEIYREPAIVALGRIGDAKAASILADAYLAQRNMNVSGVIRKALLGVGKPAAAALQNRLAQESDPLYRQQIEDLIYDIQHANSDSPEPPKPATATEPVQTP